MQFCVWSLTFDFAFFLVSYLLSQGADPKLADKAGVSSIDLAEKASNSVRAAFGLPAVERGSCFRRNPAHCEAPAA